MPMTIIEETSVLRAAQLAGLDLDPAHLPGVVLYYRMLAEFSQTVAAFPLDETIEPAAVFTPCPVPAPA